MSDTSSAPGTGPGTGAAGGAGTARPTVITPTDDGPLEVDGPVSVRRPDGTVIREASKVFLCRCGHSGRKPWCDGSHSRQGWRA